MDYASEFQASLALAIEMAEETRKPAATASSLHRGLVCGSIDEYGWQVQVGINPSGLGAISR